MVALQKFAATAFDNARVPVGGPVAPFSLESTSPVAQANVPFKFAQPFNEGDLLPTDGLIAVAAGAKIPLQVDFKASHNDGSMRHAVISGIWPALAAGEQVDISMVRALPGSKSAVIVPSFPVSVIIKIDGVEYAAKTGGTGMTWLSGPVVVERIHNVPFMRDGVEHPDLTAQFSVRQFGAVGATVDVAIEHAKAYSQTGDIAYDAKIIVGGFVRYEQAGLVHFHTARWKKTFWIGQDYPVHIKHDIGYLIGTKAVSNYDRRVTPSEKTLAGYATELSGPTFAPMGPGPFQRAMATTGGRPDIGLAPDSYAMTILTMDKRAKAMMLASADAAGSWSAHRRDDSEGPANGQPLDVIHFPRATLLGTHLDSRNRSTGQYEKLPRPASSSGLREDISHQPAFAYIPYLMTGDYYYLEELLFWNGYNLYSLNPGYRMSEQGLFGGGQVRGQAWTLRTLAEAGYITPDDHPAKPALLYWAQTNATRYSDLFLGGKSSNRLGVLTSGGSVVYLDGTGIGPWQDDFFTSAVGRAVELGFDSLKPLLNWKAKFPVGRMVSSGYCWANAAVYSLRVRDSKTSPLYETLAECYENTFDAQYRSTPCGSAERLAHMNKILARPAADLRAGEMTGYSSSTAGFPSNMQPALAMAADAGIEGSKLAWARFDGRANQPNYGTSPQFAIVPRAAAVVAPVKPPVEPDPMPVPVLPPPEPVKPEDKTMTVSVSVTSADGKVIAFSFPVQAE